jgi:hypothetical protein
VVALCEGFERFLSVPSVSSAVKEGLWKRLEGEETGPYNTHPPLCDRIAAIRNSDGASVPQDVRPASVLIENLASTELRFVQNSFSELKTANLNYVHWDDVALRVTVPAWQKFVSEYAEALKGVTAELVPDYVARFPEIGSRIRDPKGMLLSPPQRTVARAGTLFAAALALRMIATGWLLQVQPATFHIRRGDNEFNPFEAVGQLMGGKISRESWIAQCRELNISHLALHPGEPDKPTAPSAQAELFSVETGGPAT